MNNIENDSNTIIYEEIKESGNEVNNVEILDNKEDNKIILEEKVDEVSQDIIDNNIYVSVKRSSGEIIKLELEEYVFGVVAAEMPAEFHSEALKSQAVIARTYALKTMERNGILTDSITTQSYKSNEELQNIWGSKYSIYYNKLKDAVEKTSGYYLVYNGKYIDCVYHSTSNGVTEDSINVWGNSYPYLVSVSSSYDANNPSFEQEKELSYQYISTKLGMEVNSNSNFDILGKTTGSRVSKINVNDKLFTGVEFRNLLGLRSADFEITKSSTGIIIKTRGYGHGVGLSQYGANGMAKNGYNYEQILKHYYTGVNINHL